MDEYLLLVLFMLLRLAVPREYNEQCKQFFKTKEDGRGIHYDLNRFSGIQIIGLEVISHDGLHHSPHNYQAMVNLCQPFINNGICTTNGTACIFATSDARDVYQMNQDDSIIIKNGTTDALDFDLVDSVCKNDSSKPFIYHFHMRCNLKWSGFGSCEVNIFWLAGGYCGIFEDEIPCGVQLEHNVTLDLIPLRSNTFWTTRDPFSNKTYQLNICGPVKKGACNSTAYICEIDEVSNKTTVLADTMYAFYSRAIGIVIGFAKKERGRGKAEVGLQCVPNNEDFRKPILSFKVKKKTKSFLMETPLGCVAPPPLCVAIDEETGHQYNLYSLAGQVMEFDYGASKLIISVCGPLYSKRDPKLPCSGPGFASCQIRGKTVIRVMGMLGQVPEVITDRNNKSHSFIRFVFPDGDRCGFGKPGQRYKTYLELYCEYIPNLIKIEEFGCDMYVRHITPAACPNRDVVGKDCKIQSPLDNSTIDLSDLRKETDITFPVLTRDLKPKLRFNLCGPLVKPCSGITNTSVCWYKGDVEYPIGPLATIPKYYDGIIKFDFFGAPCEIGKDFTKVTIMLYCDWLAKTIQPSNLDYEEQDCHFYVIWRTNKVCPRYVEEGKCNVRSEKSGNWFDLSTLSNPELEHKIPVLYENSSKVFNIILNICGSFENKEGNHCPTYSEICWHRRANDSLSKDFFISLGAQGETGPFVDDKNYNNNTLKIYMKNGDICDNNKKRRYSSTVTFICDPMEYNSSAISGELSSTCHFEFRWKTKHACPASYNERYREKKQSCVAVNKKSFKRFNLNPLKNKMWVMPISPPAYPKTAFAFLSVCSRLPKLENGNCGLNAGTCIQNFTTLSSLGVFNDDLKFNGNQLVLSYQSGTQCEETDVFQSEISFLCTNEFFPRNGPQYVGVNKCVQHFVFYTDLACEDNTLYCSVDTHFYGEGVDISLVNLMQPTVPYRVESPDGHVFLINICSSLPSFSREGCKEGASICMLHSDSRFPIEKPLSLGTPHSRPYLDHPPGDRKPQVVWQYYGDEPCPFPSKGKASATIRFICDPSIGPGRPKYEGKGTGDCNYLFSWNTSVVCIDDRVEFDRQNCLLTNHGTHETFNLTRLYPEVVLMDMVKGFKPSLTGENLFVYLCAWPQYWMDGASSETIECKDTAVCAHLGNGFMNFTGFGYQHFAYYDSSNNTVKIFFRGTYRNTCADRVRVKE
ncbi:Cation-independent mannose-6-phosphate receptor [Frankliniella fusca]|uniref:Cation-independent mannose-6-phosphate receptor n=1 Tax=Frankliniella fusca TaxID=407009 RepID=A0AAE1HQ48_9NEOP|nr:Cation-independent mannose-6-phosphate receptor [Frankliniella fusca]